MKRIPYDRITLLVVLTLLSACAPHPPQHHHKVLVADATTIKPSLPVPFSKPTPPPRVIVPQQNMNAPVARWCWPARGKVSPGNKGITIHGKNGDPIFAAAAGKVVYSGHGLRGYGNLIIIKHNNTFLSAYAHNKVSFVKEGDNVRAKQKIAEMGHTGASQTALHFEIRSHGHSVNPLLYLTCHD